VPEVPEICTYFLLCKRLAESFTFSSDSYHKQKKEKNGKKELGQKRSKMPARVGSFVFLEMSCLGVCVCFGLAYQGKNIGFRFIIEYSSLRDFGP
jgi:hypothetical protein